MSLEISSFYERWQRLMNLAKLEKIEIGFLQPVSLKDLAKNPRPALILQDPLALSNDFIEDLKFISHLPYEQIETSWWEIFCRLPQKTHRTRDYYFALNSEGQLLWIYKELECDEYFLHGYFD